MMLIIQIALGITLAFILLEFLPQVLLVMVAILGIGLLVGLVAGAGMVVTIFPKIFEPLIVIGSLIFIVFALWEIIEHVIDKNGIFNPEIRKPFPKTGSIAKKWDWLIDFIGPWILISIPITILMEPTGITYFVSENIFYTILVAVINGGCILFFMRKKMKRVRSELNERQKKMKIKMK